MEDVNTSLSGRKKTKAFNTTHTWMKKERMRENFSSQMENI
jgi:hypothetical protein